MTKIVLYTDGGSRNNPGHAGIGGIGQSESGQEIIKFKNYIGIATNNQAEYQALKKGLELALAHGFGEIECYLDSELVVRQLNGQYKIKDENIKDLAREVMALKNQFKNVTISHVSRDKNKIADQLVNEAIDEYLQNAN